MNSNKLHPSLLISLDSNPNRYEELRFSRNLRIDVNPLAIVLPNATADVAAVMQCVYASKTKACVRSGRHSYEGYSTCENGVVIDLRHMKQFSVDKDSNIVTLSPAITHGEAYSWLWEANHLTIPGGSCNTVAMGMPIVLFI